MILLNDISKKIQAVLDGTDTEIPTGVSKPTDLDFVIKTAGFHLDNIYNKKTWRNFIPVFINSLGGQFNPVPQLKEKTQSVGIAFYFPVRLKDEIDVLCSYMADVFVGTYLTYYGTHKCVSNLSVPQIQEIQNLDLNQFEKWIQEKYQKTINITEPYLAVSMTLYITDVREDFMIGNSVKYELQARFRTLTVNELEITYSHSTLKYQRYSTGDETVDGKTYYAFRNSSVNRIFYTDVEPISSNGLVYVKHQFGLYLKINNEFEPTNAEIVDISYIAGSPTQKTTELVFSKTGTGLSVNPVAQQLIGEQYAKNIDNIKNYNKSLLVYFQDNDFWNYLLYAYNTQNLSLIVGGITLIKKYGNGMTFAFNQITLSMNENISLGEPVTVSITLGDKK